MNIVKATERHENWLGGFMPLIADDLQTKHEAMGGDIFTFFRATFYRWAQRWQERHRSTADAPHVLGIGDIHVENFGTWRDREGRLVWGVNDFDESECLPYTNDLVRLAVSGELARRQGLVRASRASMFAAVLLGYSEGLRQGGGPLVIEERNAWLRELAQSTARAPARYWKKLLETEAWQDPLSRRAARLLREVPKDAHPLRIIHRIAGAGSLGRPRFAALYEWRGGYLAREVKARAPSAWTFATDSAHAVKLVPLLRVWKRAVRCPDPYLTATRHWVSRRLSPDCSRIELADLPRKRQEIALFRAMGWEVANVHLGSASAADVGKHLDSLPRRWLTEACELMLSTVQTDFHHWRRHMAAIRRRS